MNRIDLIDININGGAAIDALAELSAKAVELAKKQKELASANKEVDKSIAEQIKSLNAGELSLEEYNKSVNSLVSKQLGLKSSMSEVRGEVAANEKEIKALTSVNNAQAGSVVEMRAKLSLLTKEWANMSAHQRDNTVTGKAHSAEMRGLSDNLKKLESGVGNNTRNVGNYSESILQAAHNTKGLSGGVSGLAGGMASGITGIKAFNLALSANPIGAIATGVLFLVTSIDKLVTRNSSASNEIGASFSSIKVLFDRLLDGITAGIGIWTSGIEKIVDGYLWLGSTIGFISAESLAAARSADDLTRATRALFLAETDMIVATADRTAKIAELREQLANQSISENDRLAIGKETLALVREQTAADVGLAKSKYDLVVANNALSNSTDKDLRAEAEAYAAYSSARASGAKDIRTLISSISAIEKKQASESLAAVAHSEKEKLAAVERANVERLSAAEKFYDNERAAVMRLITAAELDLRAKRIENERITGEELEAIQEEQMNRRIELLSIELERGKITMEEFTLARISIELDFSEFKKKEGEKRVAEEVASLAAAEAARYDSLIASAVTEYERRRIILEEKRRQEIESAELTGRGIAEIEARYAAQARALDDDERDHKLSELSKLAGDMADILGRESAAGKTLAVAQATINTYQGATKAIATGGLLGIAQAAVVIAAGLANVAKIAAVKVDVGSPAKKKYAKGGKVGLFGGNLHSNGGTHLRGSDGTEVEVERGESFYVLNRKATSAIASLSSINSMFGGEAFSAGKTNLATGGVAALGGPVATITVEQMRMLADFIAESNRALPSPTVYVSEIDLVRSRISTAKSISVV